MLKTKLTHKEKAELFYELFDMHYVNVLEDEDTDEELHVLFDENWEEYEGDFQFETLKDFFIYCKSEGIKEGRCELQRDIKKLLNL